MGVEAEKFGLQVWGKHGVDGNVFEDLVSYFFGASPARHDNTNFAKFTQKYCNVKHGGAIHDKLFDLFNYIRVFENGGKFELFKNRQPEWGGLPVILRFEDVPSSDVGELPKFLLIYRGMSSKECDNGGYSQSWTLSLDVARRFAFENYPDEERGVVASGIISRDTVIHYSSEDEENEIIVGCGLMKGARKLEV